MTQSYFLGANSAYGFHSCYESFCTAPDDFLYIIKGGPGSGKSTFMKKIGAAAEHAGLDVHYVFCSGDPDSLDGVYLPKLHLGYVDGTAPHVIEPAYPGVGGCYLDFSRYFDVSALRALGGEIRHLNAAYKAEYQSAYAFLAKHRRGEIATLSGARRYRHAVTCRGIVSLPSPKSPKLVTEAELRALVQRDGVIAYLHPLYPQTVIGVYDTNSDEYLEIPFDLPDCSDAIASLQKAKQIHDELERCYRPFVDFGGIDKLTQTHIKKALSDCSK